MKIHVLEREQLFSQARAELFPFFVDAGNLAAITPAFLRFRILTPLPLELKPGSLLDYRLRLYGFPVRWRTRIETFDPPVRFTDRQVKGPFRLWHHTHTFEDRDGGTLMRDVVEYAMPLGPLGALARAVLIRRTLDRIFDFRRDVLAAQFGDRRS